MLDYVGLAWITLDGARCPRFSVRAAGANESGPAKARTPNTRLPPTLDSRLFGAAAAGPGTLDWPLSAACAPPSVMTHGFVIGEDSCTSAGGSQQNYASMFRCTADTCANTSLKGTLQQ